MRLLDSVLSTSSPAHNAARHPPLYPWRGYPHPTHPSEPLTHAASLLLPAVIPTRQPPVCLQTAMALPPHCTHSCPFAHWTVHVDLEPVGRPRPISDALCDVVRATMTHKAAAWVSLAPSWPHSLQMKEERCLSCSTVQLGSKKNTVHKRYHGHKNKSTAGAARSQRGAKRNTKEKHQGISRPIRAEV